MKITFFFGRVHHALKLSPVASALQEAGHTIDILIANNSINIDPATEYLPQFGISQFHHALAYLVADPDAWSKVNALRNDLFYINEVTNWVAPFWLLSSIREAAEDYVGFSNYLDTQKPDAVFALHENNFFVKILFYLAQQKSITTYSLQEGLILEREETDLAKYSTGTTYTDVLFSWSEYDKQFYSDESKIVPVGPVHLDYWIGLKGDEQAKASVRQQLGISQDQTVICLAPPRLDLYLGDPGKAINMLAEWTRDRGIILILKLHPFQGGVEQIQQLVSRFNHVLISDKPDAIPYVFASDVLVTQTSTIALEALCLGIPVVELDIDYMGLEQPLWKHGYVKLIEGNNLDELLTSSEVSDIGERIPLADGQSIKRIVDYIGARQWAK